MKEAIRYTFFVFFVILVGTSCTPMRYLQEGETFLKKNKISIKDKKNADDYGDLKYQLGTKVYQKPNSKFLGMPTLGPWFYYRAQGKSDPSKWNRFVLKKWAEEPAIYNSDIADASAKNLEKYLQLRGYFDAHVNFETKKKGLRKKKTHVKYNVTVGERYYIDGLNYVSKDPEIHRILQKIKGNSFLKTGTPADGGLYELERRRITNYLKNSGYANFYINYISSIEANREGKKIRDAQIEVLLPNDSTLHKKYYIGDISVVSLFDEKGNPILEKDTTINTTLFYVKEKGRHFIKLKTLEREIFLKKGALYQADNIDKTRVQLGGLDLFQFVNVRRVPHPTVDSLLNYEIRLIPKKRQALGVDFELNNSRAVNNNFLGTAASLSYKNRNFFRGGEVFTARTEGGFEVEPRRRIKDFKVNAWNIDLNFGINFPRYHDVLKIDKGLSYLFVRKKNWYRKLKEQASSKASLRYSILANTGSYQINVFAGSFGWRIRPKKHWRVSVNKIGIDFLEPSLEDGFRTEFVEKNPFLENSLRPQLFTGAVLFRNIDVIYQKNNRRGGKYSWYGRANLEVSGLEMGIVNDIRNAFSSNNITFKLLDKYEFSRYVRLETDVRSYRKLGGGKLIAARLNTAIAFDYGTSDEVPYVKQFFVGGPTSLRAWQIRQLGPGAYVDTASIRTGNHYQTGDFKLEMNLEYRFNIAGYLKGAVFLDVGNIWTLGNDEREGSGVDDFFNKIAVGTGVGFRFDIEYVVFRFDLGYKLRNPFLDEENRYWQVQSFKDLAFNKFLGSLSIGYPF